ncbi:G-box-binding factor isoform X2 [Armigeres subalbatus]
MRVVTATINFQDGTVNIDKMTPAQKNAYLEAHMAVQQQMMHAAQQIHQQQQQQQHQQQQQQQLQHHPQQQPLLQQPQTSSRSAKKSKPNNHESQPAQYHHQQLQQQSLQQQHQSHQQPNNVITAATAGGSINTTHYANTIKVPQITTSSISNTTNISTAGGDSSTFTVPDDVGMGFEGGVRVLQSLGNWSPEIPPNIPRPNLIPFTEPYTEGGSMHPATRLKALQQVQQASSKKSTAKPKTPVTNNTGPPKPVFECTICGKGLARKDKLTIHMRIHTGEKPYVCEVCDRAFARRDKLVIHMNKFKHVTPTNIAPLGKRQNRVPTLVKKEDQKSEDNKPILIDHHALATQTLTTVVNSISAQQQQQHQGPPPGQMNQTTANVQQQNSGTSVIGMSMPQQHHHQLSWTCELCGRMFQTREEWTLHAKSHLEY